GQRGVECGGELSGGEDVLDPGPELWGQGGGLAVDGGGERVECLDGAAAGRHGQRDGQQLPVGGGNEAVAGQQGRAGLGQQGGGHGGLAGTAGAGDHHAGAGQVDASGVEQSATSVFVGADHRFAHQADRVAVLGLAGRDDQVDVPAGDPHGVGAGPVVDVVGGDRVPALSGLGAGFAQDHARHGLEVAARGFVDDLGNRVEVALGQVHVELDAR